MFLKQIGHRGCVYFFSNHNRKQYREHVYRSKARSRKFIHLREKLCLGDLNSWYLATPNMKAYEGLTMHDNANVKWKWKIFRINNQQANIADNYA